MRRPRTVDVSILLVGLGCLGLLSAQTAFAWTSPGFNWEWSTWRATDIVVVDPDGNDVGLMSPLDPARRTWPPVDSPAT